MYKAVFEFLKNYWPKLLFFFSIAVVIVIIIVIWTSPEDVPPSPTGRDITIKNNPE
jgi:hypothetical protein